MSLAMHDIILISERRFHPENIFIQWETRNREKSFRSANHPDESAAIIAAPESPIKLATRKVSN